MGISWQICRDLNTSRSWCLNMEKPTPQMTIPERGHDGKPKKLGVLNLRTKLSKSSNHESFSDFAKKWYWNNWNWYLDKQFEGSIGEFSVEERPHWSSHVPSVPMLSQCLLMFLSDWWKYPTVRCLQTQVESHFLASITPICHSQSSEMLQVLWITMISDSIWYITLTSCKIDGSSSHTSP